MDQREQNGLLQQEKHVINHTSTLEKPSSRSLQKQKRESAKKQTYLKP